jgi:hypothetical protein
MASRHTVSLTLANLLFLAAVLHAQTDFSARLTNSWGGSVQNEKIFVSGDRVRVESIPSAGTAPSILDMDTRITRIVVADKKTFMEGPPGAGLQRGYAFFRVADPENACDIWLKLVFLPQSKCQKIGPATINGRNAVEYEGNSSDGELRHVWIDNKLAFPIQWDSKGGSGSLRDIQEGPQPAALFEIPVGFTKINGFSTTHHMSGMLPQATHP